MSTLNQDIRSLGNKEELERRISECELPLTDTMLTIIRAVHSGETFKDVGTRLGKSRSRVSQIAHKAYIRLSDMSYSSNFEPLFRGLTTRAFNCLLRTGLNTTDKVISYIEKNNGLKGIRNAGKSVENEVVTKLNTLGYKVTIIEEEVKERKYYVIFDKELNNYIGYGNMIVPFSEAKVFYGDSLANKYMNDNRELREVKFVLKEV